MFTEKRKSPYEQSKILKSLPKDLIDACITNEVLLIGGAITSIFSEMPINDFDFYLSDKSKRDSMKNFMDKEYKILFASANAITYQNKNNKKRYQLIIHPLFNGSPDEIFEYFDFTICMGAYSFVKEEFIFHCDFLKHIAQRKLVFNNGTQYPINSLIRVKKYINRGYEIRPFELLKISLSINKLLLQTNQDLKEQLDGIDTLFLKEYTDELAKDPNKEINIDEVLLQVEEAMNEYINPDGKE